MAEYAFRTSWRLVAPREQVFDALHDSERWPEWWRGLRRVEKLEQGDADGRGSLGRYTWRSLLPYRLEFDMRITRVDRPHAMEGEAGGQLAGTGRWDLFDEGDTTLVAFAWDVRTTQRWMNLLAPVGRPVFTWNHDWIMRQGAEGLARRLGVELVSAPSTPGSESCSDRGAPSAAPRPRSRTGSTPGPARRS